MRGLVGAAGGGPADEQAREALVAQVSGLGSEDLDRLLQVRNIRARRMELVWLGQP